MMDSSKARVVRRKKRPARSAIIPLPLTPEQAEEANDDGLLREFIEPGRFKTLGPADLAVEPEPIEWLVKGVLPKGAYGPWGGAQKTLKTFNLLALALSVASGKPFLGKFSVPEPTTVKMYISEGGNGGTRRRLQMLAEYMEIDLARIPLYITFDSAPIDDPMMQEVLGRDIAWYDPGLIIMDALYGFHATDVEESNMYSRTGMLQTFQRLAECDKGRALILADHFSKANAKRLDLPSMAQAGMAEWAHSWMLSKHRVTPDVPNGSFKLLTMIGGRDGYGGHYDIDWELGVVDPEMQVHMGPVSYSCTPSTGEDKVSTNNENAEAMRITRAICSTLRDKTGRGDKTSTKTIVKPIANCADAKFNRYWMELCEQGFIFTTTPGRKGAVYQLTSLGEDYVA